MAKKITYSRRPDNKRRVPSDYDSIQDDPRNHKRPKADGSHELHLPPTPPPGKGEKKHSLLKKNLRFGGPTSVPDEHMDVEMAPVGRKNLAVFDKVVGRQYQPVKLKQNNIHGSREEFAATMKNANRPKNYDSRPRGSYLPTPPAEAQRKAHEEASRHLDFSGANGSAAKSANMTLNESKSLTYKSRGVKDKQPKEPYQAKAYTADEIAAPRRTIDGNRLSKSSCEARLWSVNQTQSPFLRLPGEIRNTIYQYALGGGTVNIGYETYRTTYKSDKPCEVTPVFKYHCTVYNQPTNPFKGTKQPWINASTGYTPLNNICRQMYMEAATLPYKHNIMSFDTHNIMFNMLYKDQRLSRQQLDAITQIILPDILPPPNMLVHLRNLDKVFLAFDQDHNDKGWYKVVRSDGSDPKLVNEQQMRKSTYTWASRRY